MDANRKKGESVAWIASSYGHDWRATGFVEDCLGRALALGGLGLIESAEAGDDFAPLPIPIHRLDDVPALIAGWLGSTAGPMQVGAAGTRPAPWSVHVSIIPDPGHFIGRLSLRMDARRLSGRSAQLWDAFHALHSGRDTSHACLHPWTHWIKVRDRRPPLVNAATLQTILWANYVGPDLMAKFERERLDLSVAYAAETTAEGGVFLRLSEHVLDAVLPATRAALDERRDRLYQAFLDARRY